jgi:transcriptional regulator with XRE-family HTH domain
MVVSTYSTSLWFLRICSVNRQKNIFLFLQKWIKIFSFLFAFNKLVDCYGEQAIPFWPYHVRCKLLGMSPLAEYLKRLRQIHGFSQEKFGALIGMHGSNISTVEAGNRYAPEIDVLAPLQEKLGLSGDDHRELLKAANASPRRVTIPTDASAAAFSFMATLLTHWHKLSDEDFAQLSAVIMSRAH